MRRSQHYEQAFEAYLRSNRIPYVSVDEARKALLPSSAALEGQGGAQALKSFDFVIYGQGTNLLVDIKGRKVAQRRRRHGPDARPARPRLESWVTRDDVDSMRIWERLFGPGFVGAFVFVYWCQEQPPDALFQEVFIFRTRWYALRAITLEAYASAMRVRSPRWRTVHLGTQDFARLSQPVTTSPLDPEAPVELPALHPLCAPVGSAS